MFFELITIEDFLFDSQIFSTGSNDYGIPFMPFRIEFVNFQSFFSEIHCIKNFAVFWHCPHFVPLRRPLNTWICTFAKGIPHYRTTWIFLISKGQKLVFAVQLTLP